MGRKRLGGITLKKQQFHSKSEFDMWVKRKTKCVLKVKHDKELCLARAFFIIKKYDPEDLPFFKSR